MVTVQVLLRFSLFALLFVDVHGFPVKGSQVQGKPRDPDGHHVGSQQGSTTGHSTPLFHRASGGVSRPVKHLGPPQYVQAQPVPITLGSAMPDARYTSSSGSPVPLQGGYVAGSYVPVQAGPSSLVPLPAAYAASSESGTRATLPEMEWSIPPNAFEEASTNTQSQDNSMVLPQLPQAPALQSGETSNVVKEAELGNFHQQTEEFGYPAMGPVQGFPPVVLSPGVWGYPSPYPLPYHDFDYRLLYGLYPPGTYTTFSKEHEKGKDHYQTIHYLKEHGSDAPDAPQNTGSGQQKVFPGVRQTSAS
ncbi:hypothetical protein AMECASPLE_028389 [Ameca splendens]|uniref:Uncharacterized protein n=1 Tax=Ameca splendens TaxID=208324 RepID=A0ABV0XII1_9TELE